MITKTSLKHPTMRAKIIQATSGVIHKGHIVEHVHDAKGIPVMVIAKWNGKIKVTDRMGRDITKAVADSF